MKKLVVVFAFAALLAASARAQDQPAFTATVDRTGLMVGERLQLMLSIEGAELDYRGGVNPPSLEPHFRLVGSDGPSTESRMQIIGSTIQKWKRVRFSYVYEARQAGRVTIPSLNYRVGGQTLSTNPITVEIREAPPPGTEEGGTAWQPPSDPYLEIKVSKERVYVGEQAVASWQLYFRQPFEDPRLSRISLDQDFIVAELGSVTSLNPVTRNLGGVDWQVAFIKSMALYPIKAGEAYIDPMQLLVKRPSSVRDVFGMVRWKHDETASRPVRIEILPLPIQGKPADFSGAVGEFTIRLDRRSAVTKTGEQLKFSLVIDGTGHPDFIPKPEIELPDGLDLYTEAADKGIRQEAGRAIGTRVFKMILVSRVTGDFFIGPFSFSYFDPADSTYKTARSAQLRVSVQQGKETESASGPVEQETLAVTGEDLRYIKPDREDVGGSGKWLLSSPLSAGLQLAPAIAVAAAFFARRRRERLSTDRAYARQLRAGRRFKKSLALARKKAGSGEVQEAYFHVYRALVGYVGDKCNLPDEGMTTADAVTALRGAGAGEEAVSEVESILNECDRARFAPGALTPEGAGEMIERLVKLVRDLDREVGR